MSEPAGDCGPGRGPASRGAGRGLAAPGPALPPRLLAALPALPAAGTQAPPPPPPLPYLFFEPFAFFLVSFPVGFCISLPLPACDTLSLLFSLFCLLWPPDCCPGGARPPTGPAAPGPAAPLARSGRRGPRAGAPGGRRRPARSMSGPGRRGGRGGGDTGDGGGGAVVARGDAGGPGSSAGGAGSGRRAGVWRGSLCWSRAAGPPSLSHHLFPPFPSGSISISLSPPAFGKLYLHFPSPRIPPPSSSRTVCLWVAPPGKVPSPSEKKGMKGGGRPGRAPLGAPAPERGKELF